MQNMKLDLKNATIAEKDIMQYGDKVEKIHNQLHQKVNDENEFLGWLELPTNYDKKEFEAIKKAAKKIRV